MKIATRNTIAAALAVALAGMGMPVAALAASAADETAASAAAVKEAADVTVVTDDDFRSAKIGDLEGKWFRVVDNEGNALNGEDSSVRFKYQRSGAKMNLWVDGSGDAGEAFPRNDAMKDWMYSQKGHDWGVWYGTLQIGEKITRIGSPDSVGYVTTGVDVVFAEGSQVTYLGYSVFEAAKSVNLEVCTKLKKLDAFSMANIKKPVKLPASIETIERGALQGTSYTAADAEGTSIPSTNTVGATVIDAPKIKVTSSNKVTVSWAKPFVGKVTVSASGSKYTKSYVSYAVKYKVQYRVKGDKTWKKTGYTSEKSKTLTMLTKGKKYQVRITAYKKSGSKWKALTTSTYKTSSAVKGYNPAPSLKAGKKTITASWTKVPGATSYKVYYRTGSGSWKAKTSKKASLKIGGLAAGTKYQVKVRAYKGKSGICESTAKSATTAA